MITIKIERDLIYSRLPMKYCCKILEYSSRQKKGGIPDNSLKIESSYFI